MNKSLVAVYGSLRENMGNHKKYLGTDQSKLIGSFKTEPVYTLFSLGYYPGLLKEGKTSITLEIYEVEESVLTNLDYLEGYNEEKPEDSHYVRELINTPFGECFIYFYNGENKKKDNIVKSGDWVEYRESLEIN